MNMNMNIHIVDWLSFPILSLPLLVVFIYVDKLLQVPVYTSIEQKSLLEGRYAVRQSGRLGRIKSRFLQIARGLGR
jgi:hypothetical protein